eukprot:comp16949_c0_seq1/m.15547 comp16949_c0_seq1/g.15547  ORF comp16949_c0_seq1/g.15547 comp16949_c0_seq1/m.15547 type:complete len:183 (-) comp16949_c0_seq1:521-1069(-)
MGRKLRHHEQKLLKKVDFLQWKSDSNQKEAEIIRRYHIHKRDDYKKYNRLVGMARSLSSKLAELEPQDPVRLETTDALLTKLYNMGVLPTKKSLVSCEKLTVSAFCRRRLPVVMVRVKMAETVKEATQLVEQGHVRVGPETVTDPAFMVTRAMEDFVTWVDTSKIKRHVMKYNDRLDDYDLL